MSVSPCLLLLVTLANLGLADQHPPQYGAPPPVKEEAKPYAYQYGVQDEYSGANFAANENSDAKVVTGSYTVHLPDGRVQTVTYTADHYNGYVADVKVRKQISELAPTFHYCVRFEIGPSFYQFTSNYYSFPVRGDSGVPGGQALSARSPAPSIQTCPALTSKDQSKPNIYL